MRYVENVMEAITDGITVANLRRSDIQKVSIYDYTQYKHKETDWKESEDGTLYFGASKTYQGNIKYPAIYEKDKEWTYKYEEGKITGSDKECLILEKEDGYVTESGYKEENTSTVFKQSYYAHDYLNHDSQFINKLYYDLLFKNPDGKSYLNSSYWISGRSVNLYSGSCSFEMQRVSAGNESCYICGWCLYSSVR